MARNENANSSGRGKGRTNKFGRRRDEGRSDDRNREGGKPPRRYGSRPFKEGSDSREKRTFRGGDRRDDKKDFRGGDRRDEKKSFRGGDRRDDKREFGGPGRGTRRDFKDNDRKQGARSYGSSSRGFGKRSDDERTSRYKKSDEGFSRGGREERGDRFKKPGARSFDRRDKGEREDRYKSDSRGRKPGGDRSSDRDDSKNRGFKARGGSFRGKPYQSGEGESRPRRKSFTESRIDRQTKHIKNAPANVHGESSEVRLNRFIANSGVCSRREADELITAGLITVNGKSVTELGYKVKRSDDVRYEGKRLNFEKPVYILLNKPKGFITTTEDPQERNTVMGLIQGACKERVYPVGRLDRNTSGLLLLTNDGELTEKLTHPSYNIKKIYKVELDRPLTKNDFTKIREGIMLEEGRAQVDDLAIVSPDGKTVGLEIHIGWNRIVRRIFEALDYKVEKLDRTVYATLDKKDLPRGHWRFLNDSEVVRLKHLL